MPCCPYCSKKFGRISTLQNHTAFCAIQHQGKYAAKNSMEEMDIPPIRDMYIVLQKLVMENTKMRSEINELKKIASREKKKIPLVDWLNINKSPEQTFAQWVNKINVTQKDFEYALNSNCVNSVMEIIKKNINDNIPICSFDQNLKTIFIYVKKSWRIIENDEFHRFVDSIIRKIGKQFDKWINKNSLELRQNDEKMHIYTKKLYSMDIEDVAKKVHLKLYNFIKYNLRNIIEYEFTF